MKSVKKIIEKFEKFLNTFYEKFVINIIHLFIEKKKLNFYFGGNLQTVFITFRNNIEKTFENLVKI